MIAISIPASLIPDSYKHTIQEPYYRNGMFHSMREKVIVPLNNELCLDNAYNEDSFFSEMSGNEFVKLIERDALPDWATPELLFKHSNASGTVNPVTRKIKWIRQRKNCYKANQVVKQPTSIAPSI